MRLTWPNAKMASPHLIAPVALLRCADPGQAEAATSVLDQIARASSSNATATRRLVGSSTASS
jgi:hypothetical protein